MAQAINIVVNLSTGGATAAVQQFNATLTTVGSTAQRAANQANSALNSMSGTINKVNSAFEGLATTLATMQLGSWLRSMIESGDEVNRVEIALRTMTGSAYEARKIVQEISELAKTQPFAFPELLAMAQRLKAFGFEAAEIPAKVKGIANAAAALGGSKQAIDSITLALGQMKSKGIAQGQELFRQLAEQGILSGKYLRAEMEKELGRPVSETELRKYVEKRMVSAQGAIKAIFLGMEQQFGEAGAAVTEELLTARITKMTDEFHRLAAVLSKDLLPILKPILEAIGGLIGAFKELPQPIRQVIIVVGLLTFALTAYAAAARAAQVAGLVDMFSKIARWAPVASIITNVATAVRSLGAAALAATGSTGTLTTLFSTSSIASVGSFGAALAGLLPIIATLGLAWLAYKIAEESALTDPEVDKRMREGKKKREELVADIEKMETTLRQRGQKVEPPKTHYRTQFVEDLEKRAAVLKGLTAESDALIMKGEADAKRKRDIAQDALERAQAHFIGGLGAIELQFEKLRRQVKGNAEDEAKIAQAQYLEILVFKRKFYEEQEKIALATRQFRRESAAQAEQRAGQMRLTELEALPETSIEVTRAISQERLRIQTETAEQAKKIEIDAAEDRYNVEKRKIEEEFRKKAMTREMFERAISEAYDTFLAHRERITKRTEDEIAQYRLDTSIKTNEAVARDWEWRLRYLSEGIRLEGERALQQAEGVTPTQTIGQQIDQIQRVAAVRVATARKLQTEQEVALQVEHDRRYAALTQTMALDKRLGEYQAQEDERYRREKELLEKRNINEIAGYEIEAQRKVNDIALNEQKRIYDSLKDSVSRVFDALLDKSTSVWEAMANAFKTAMITAIKEIVTSRVAAMLFQMFGYGQVRFGGGMPGMGGQQPVFGGGGFGGGGGVGSLASLGGLIFGGGGFGGGGGAGGFAGPAGSWAAGNMGWAGGGAGGLGGPSAWGVTGAQMAGASAMGGKFGGGGLLGGAAGLAGLKALFGMGGSVATGAGSATTWAAASSIQKLAALGHSTGALLAGAGLVAAGLHRGGASGLGMTTAGGALIGFKFGGPIGAAIGAAAGAIAGTIRLFMKGADQKVQEKVKQVYAVDIKEKNIRMQILELAKQKYGGNLDLAIRSPEVRELVQLYAATQGTQAQNMPRPMYPATFAQGGGSLSVQPVYSNGMLVSNPYTGTTTSQWAAQGMYIQLNPQSANDLFEGKVVNVLGQNPGAVAESSANGTRSGVARDAQRGSLLEPLTVMR